MYGARLAVHRNGRVHRAAAERFVHALHTEAYAQNGKLSLAAADELGRNSGGARVPGPWADEDVVGAQARGVFYRERVRAEHRDVQVVASEHLHEVEGEGVVVVDD